MVNDPIGDALARIKNGYMASRVDVELLYSKLIMKLCELLEKEGYVDSCKKTSDRVIKVTLKYEDKEPALTNVKRISKPGLRVYKGVKQVPSVLNGMGIAVISTPKGLMTGKQARKEGVGGELMALVW